jgi:hypothetical protein
VREIVSVRFVQLAALSLFTMSSGACGGSSGDSSAGSSNANGKEVTGVFVPQAEGLYQRFEFQPGHKVAVTFFTAQPRVVDYAVMPEGRIQVLADKVLTLRQMGDGCLVIRAPGDDGVEVDVPDFGRYCRQ